MVLVSYPERVIQRVDFVGLEDRGVRQGATKKRAAIC